MNFRPATCIQTQAYFGKVKVQNPVKLAAKLKLARQTCSVPIISEPKSLQQNKFLAAPTAVSSMFGRPSCVRWSHTDVVFPDFTNYRKESTKDPTKKSLDNEDSRKLMPYLAYGFGGMIGLYMTKHIVRGIVDYKNAPRDMLAMASIEINLKDISEGKSCTFMWRGKPVFVRHRSKEQIEIERRVDVKSLRHPESDQERTKKDEWLVVIGICTHLGCVPLANSGLFAGYYCPCHGSHYDMSGRIRQGPAPLNLELPPDFEFVGDDKLVVGKT